MNKTNQIIAFDFTFSNKCYILINAYWCDMVVFGIMIYAYIQFKS